MELEEKINALISLRSEVAKKSWTYREGGVITQPNWRRCI